MKKNFEDVCEAVYKAVGKENFEVACRHRLMADENGCPLGEHLRPIRLSDVLLATPGLNIRSDGTFIDISGYAREYFGRSVYWNLRKDDLTEQSDETLEFIASLLTPTISEQQKHD